METTKAYELRDLEARDIFTITRILSKVDFNTVKAAWEVSDEDAAKVTDPKLSEEERKAVMANISRNSGLNLVWAIIGAVPNAEYELCSFVGGMIGKKANDVAKMDPCEFIDIVIDIVNMEKFRDFLTRASKLLQ